MFCFVKGFFELLSLQEDWSSIELTEASLARSIGLPLGVDAAGGAVWAPRSAVNQEDFGSSPLPLYPKSRNFGLGHVSEPCPTGLDAEKADAEYRSRFWPKPSCYLGKRTRGYRATNIVPISGAERKDTDP